LLNLVGELVIARGRLDRRLERLADLEALALSRGARMSEAVEEFGARHLYPQLQAAGPAGAADQQGAPGLATGGAAAEAGVAVAAAARAATAGGLPGAPHPATAGAAADLFAELEFDRYDDFNLLARRTGEAAADLDQLHGEMAGLTTLLRDDSNQLQRLVRDLRAGIGRARMVPIGQLFARFGRLVAATAAAAGKQVALELEGGAVEVDTAVAEAIADPLMHLVQNAVTHGIESPEARRARGKAERGQLLLRAYLQGRFVTVEVEDDGGGIDPEALRREAVARGLRTPQAVATLDREQTLELVFLPGLSTSAAVTETAGRGVGMDVVRANLTRLGGDVAIETDAGAGTRVTLKAPLTLLISEALFVRVGEEAFAIPVTAVRRMVHAEAGEVAAAAGGGEELRPRGGGEDQRLPLLRLERLFGLTARRAEPWLPVVVLAAGGRRCALAVDELLGVEEVVIKGLGELLAGLPLFSGAIVTVEGRVVLLLDAPAFTQDPAALALAADRAAGAARVAALGATATGVATPGVAATGAAGAVGAGASGLAAAPLPGRRLLLVDDSVSVRKVVGQMLGRHGYRVTTAADGEEALAALREGPFDAVLTDLEMPRLNGYELIEEIRRRPEGRALPIVVITTRAGDKHLEVARRLGATACFGKPFDATALLSLLDGLAAAAGQPGSGAETGR
jgi:chemosensory pili system protein ChpA (sensor histidine kinase/response regulator)